ncbi:unnamed protein product [Rhodiola kirilowii]
MGVEALIPIFEISLEDLKLGPNAANGGCGENNDMRTKIREACEVHGCFLLRCNESGTPSLAEEMFEGMRSLFDLPDDIKRRYISKRPYSSYLGKDPIVPLQESFGIDDAHLVESSQAFTGVVWPQGNPEFCSALNGMSSIMLQLNLAMLKVIFESYGAGSCYESFAEKTSTVFRLMKYNVPLSGAAGMGLVPHTDKNALTILCQNDVQGLEIMSKDGVWTHLVVPHGCFFVVVGDVLKAWSNGRMHAVKHKVTISGNKDRYSCGLFTLPKEGVLVEVPKELVDNEHPILYKPFSYTDYVSYFVQSNNREDALEIYAGVV